MSQKKINRGQTQSASGLPYFRKCERCRKLTTANSLVTHADFPGDIPEAATPPVVCSECKRHE